MLAKPSLALPDKLRDERSPATAPNQVWALDFVHDPVFDRRKIRLLTVVGSRSHRRQYRLRRAIVVEKASRPA